MLVSSGDNIKMIETRNGEGNFDILFVSKVTGELVEIKRNIYNPKDEIEQKAIVLGEAEEIEYVLWEE